MPPWLLLLLLISLTLAFAYQCLTRQFGWRVVAYWVLIFLAVMIAEALAESANVAALRVGDLRLLPDLAGAALALGTLRLLRA